MAKAFWKGAISFGMVAIPIRVSVATEHKMPGFHYLHKKCLTRPKQVWYCPSDDEYIGLKDMDKGVEYTKGQYVVLDETDFKKVAIKSTHTIDVFGFVAPQEIDPIYYFSSHYLEPEEIGVKPFRLFREALVKTKTIGLAKVTFQRREYLCCVRPRDETLTLHTLYYQSEIRPFIEALPSEQKVSAAELDAAVSLIKVMMTGFRPQEYKDEYGLALDRLVEAKLQGKEIQAPKVAKARTVDLMTALRQSIEEAEKKAQSSKQPVGAR